MKTTRILAILVLALGLVSDASGPLPLGQQDQLPPGWYEVDIGEPPQPGSASYDRATDTWTVEGMYDAPHYVYTHLNGDGYIVARIPYINVLSSAQVAIREYLTYPSKHATLSIGRGLSPRGSGWSSSARFTYRSQTESVSSPVSIDSPGYWLLIERRGDMFRGYISPNGLAPWTQVGSKRIQMVTKTWIGIAVDGTAQFEKVTVIGDTSPGACGPGNYWTVSNGNMFSIPLGNVGIGTREPLYKLDVSGTTATDVLVIRGGADLAEPFSISDSKKIPKGALVVIDEENPGHLKLSDRPYDKRVAGVVSGAGGLNPGLTLSQQGITEGGVKVALTGRVYALADSSNGPIKPGDLLTTSSSSGHAMKATDRECSHGAVIGKAMSSLEKGQGLVLVLVSLQ